MTKDKTADVRDATSQIRSDTWRTRLLERMKIRLDKMDVRYVGKVFGEQFVADLHELVRLVEEQQDKTNTILRSTDLADSVGAGVAGASRVVSQIFW